jgi:hypothetical protein
MTELSPASPSALAAADERPTLVALVRSAAQDGATLVRGEIELAKAEARETAQKAGKGAGLLGGAAFVAVTAWFLLSFAAAFGLVAAGLPVWAGMLIVGVLYLLVAGLLGFLGRRELQRVKGLERTQAHATSLVEETKAALRPPTA